MSDPPVNEKNDTHWLVRTRTIRILWRVFAGVLAALVLGDIWIHGHASFGVDASFGFYAWYGLLTCIAMVLFAKAIGVFLKRSDDYYRSTGERRE